MSNSHIEQIKERLSIADVISSYLEINPSGSNFKAKCPFHNEKTPSFFISPARGTYYCFGCGAKGDMLSFVQEFEGLDFVGALKILAARAGVELTYESPQVKDERERLYGIMEEATTYYRNTMGLYPEARSYLLDRGLTDETIENFRIGYAPNEWRFLTDHLKKKGYTETEIEKAGLGKRSDKVNQSGQSTFYDRFRSRILFPIADSGGRVIAFSGRIFPDDADAAKYLNSPDTVLYNKSNVLYGIDKAKLEIRRMNYSIVVEGQMDLVMSHQLGCKNTVAVSGTGLSENLTSKENVVNNFGIIKRLSNNVMLAFDSDKAGLQASARAAHIALNLGMDVKVVDIPDAKDPADYIRAHGEGWKVLLKGAKHVVEFYLDKTLSAVSDGRQVVKVVKEKILPYVAAIESQMEKAHFVKLIADRIRMAEDSIWEDLKQVEQNRATAAGPEGEFVKVSPQFNRKDTVERKIAGILFWQEGKVDATVSRKDIEQRMKGIGGEAYLQKILEWAQPIEKELAFEAEITYEGSDRLLDDLTELCINLEEDYLREELVRSMELLSAAERDNDATRIAASLAHCQEISRKIQEVKNKR